MVQPKLYPETQGLPSECTTTDWVRERVEVHAPYKGIDEFTVMLEPFGDNYAEKQFLDRLDDSVSRNNQGTDWPGRYSETEQQLFTKLRTRVNARRNNTALYHPDAKEAIVELSTRALSQLAAVSAIYKKWQDGYNSDPDWPNVPVWKYPLSKVLTQAEYNASVPSTGLGPNPPPGAVAQYQMVQQRGKDREIIRDKLRKAFSLMHCAELGVAQSQAWKKNRDEWNSRAEQAGGMVISSGPSWDPSDMGWTGVPEIPDEPEVPPSVDLTPGTTSGTGGQGCPPGHWLNTDNGICIPGKPPAGKEKYYVPLPDEDWDYGDDTGTGMDKESAGGYSKSDKKKGGGMGLILGAAAAVFLLGSKK